MPFYTAEEVKELEKKATTQLYLRQLVKLN